MKKYLLIGTAIALGVFATAGRASAQLPTANFVFDQGGTNSITLDQSATSFSFSISLTFAPGTRADSTPIQDVSGIGYYFLQLDQNPPFPFAITNRDNTGSLFDDEQTDPLAYPQQINPESANDLGALAAGPLGAGTHFLANLTFSITPNLPLGSYVIGNTTPGNASSPAKASFMNDSDGDAFPVAQQTFTVTVVPEPSVYALLVTGLAIAGVSVWRRRSAA